MAQQLSTPESALRASWQRLRRRLDSASEPAPAGARGPRRRARTMGKTAMPWLIAAMVVQAIGLGALGAAWWSRPTAPAAPSSGPLAVYRTLSAPEGAPQAATIRVVFAPEVTVAQVQAMLAAARLQVRAGPSEVGVWTLGPARENELASMIVEPLAERFGFRFPDRGDSPRLVDPVRPLALLYDRAANAGRTEGPPSSRTAPPAAG